MSASPLTSTQAAGDQETQIDRVKWIRSGLACISSSYPPLPPTGSVLSLSGEPPFACLSSQAPELEVAGGGGKRKAFLRMGQAVKGDLPHAKYREEGAINAIPSSAR